MHSTDLQGKRASLMKLCDQGVQWDSSPSAVGGQDKDCAAFRD